MAYIQTIGDILNAWADYGVFAYLLPFLMIFAIVYGLLNKSNILGDNKGVQATIGLAIGLLALQFNYVASFYATIFPYAGMGIAVLLVAIIFMGFIGSGGGKEWVWFGIGAVIFLVVLFTSLSDVYWLGGIGYEWAEAWPAVLAGVILVLLIGFVVWGDKMGGGSGVGGK
ncbi:hypothetical protein HOD75_02355 [archaeon]|nr:hypothetical protein [archaeon]MBT4241720.1 hypothetical protein [archaeon]MBT4418268.1 hypothetical protein [archaeon]